MCPSSCRDAVDLRFPLRYVRSTTRSLVPSRFWLFLATLALIRDLPKTHFNINHWSSAYPIGVYGLASSQLAIDLDSPTFRVVTAIVLVILVINWLYLMGRTLPMVLSGEWFLKEAYEEGKEREKDSRASTRESREGESAEQRV
jgi:tellurite resistance protein TehA-like permease